MAMDLMGMKEVVYSNLEEGLSIIMMKLETKSGTADSIVENYATSGTTPGAPGYGINGPTGLPLTVKGRGKLTVGGVSMPYVIGQRSVNGTNVAQLVGCVTPHGKRIAVVVLGQNTQPGGEYKFELTKKFLRAVRSF
jgi:hypothetical protein